MLPQPMDNSPGLRASLGKLSVIGVSLPATDKSPHYTMFFGSIKYIDWRSATLCCPASAAIHQDPMQVWMNCLSLMCCFPPQANSQSAYRFWGSQTNTDWRGLTVCSTNPWTTNTRTPCLFAWCVASRADSLVKTCKGFSPFSQQIQIGQVRHCVLHQPMESENTSSLPASIHALPLLAL